MKVRKVVLKKKDPYKVKGLEVFLNREEISYLIKLLGNIPGTKCDEIMPEGSNVNSNIYSSLAYYTERIEEED